jgi:hypothetical protein
VFELVFPDLDREAANTCKIIEDKKSEKSEDNE